MGAQHVQNFQSLYFHLFGEEISVSSIGMLPIRLAIWICTCFWNCYTHNLFCNSLKAVGRLYNKSCCTDSIREGEKMAITYLSDEAEKKEGHGGSAGFAVSIIGAYPCNSLTHTST